MEGRRGKGNLWFPFETLASCFCAFSLNVYFSALNDTVAKIILFYDSYLIE